MPLLNASFEDPGNFSGEAASWTLRAVTSLEAIAGFGPAPERAQEDFERWVPALASLADVSVALAFFDGLVRGNEDFERGWQNDIYASEFSEAVFVAFLFGSSAIEGFGVGWLNTPFATNFDQVTATVGAFDDSPSEDFENQWQSNDTYALSFSNVGSIAAHFGSGAQAFEDFESAWSHALSL